MNFIRRVFQKPFFQYPLAILLAIASTLTYEIFVYPNSFAPTGINGLATMVQYVFGLSVGYIALLVNVPMLIVAWFVLKRTYALRTFAFVIAFADLLPVLGVGTVLVPWGLVAILQKNYYLGFGLLILYLVISLIRQFTEPRLIGKSLGLHPLLALFASYAGFLLFGFWGMLLAPLAAIVVKSLVGVPRHSS